MNDQRIMEAWRGRARVAGALFAVATLVCMAAAGQASAQCTYSISPVTRLHGHGATNGSLSMAAGPTCAWAVSNTNAWVSITSSSTGLGNGIVTYSVQANNGLGERTGTVMIATQAFVLRQSGIGCSYSISPTSRTHGYGATNGTVSITAAAGCSWNIINENDWITITSPLEGSGAGNFTYDVAVNSYPTWRTGLVTVADEVLTLLQRPSTCLYSLSPTNKPHGYGASTGQLSLTMASGCAWSVANTNSWITLTAGASGISTGGVIAVRYTMPANPTAFARSGYLVVGESTCLVTQSGTPCTYSISPAISPLHSGDIGSGQVAVTTVSGCPWSVVNTSSWITVVSGANDDDSGTVVYSVAANNSLNGRTNSLTIAGQAFKVRQQGSACTYRVSPTAKTNGYGATSGSFTLTTAGSGCNWGILNTNSWITITSPGSGTASATITYSITANEYPTERVGLVFLGKTNNGPVATFTLRQRGITCDYSLSPISRSHGPGAASNSITLTTSPNCPWIIQNTNAWIMFTSATNGTGSATNSYAIPANPAALERVGVVMIADQSLTITQRAAQCTYSFTRTVRTHGYAAVTGSVAMVSAIGCPWTVTNTNSWITILTPLNDSGSNNIIYALEANTTGVQRSGVISAAGETFTLTQLAVSCTYTITPTSHPHSSSSETGTVTVTASSACDWDAVSADSWITVISGGSGPGNGVVTYSVTANSATEPRSGTISIAGEVFTVNQAGFACSYKLSPVSRFHGYGGSPGSVTVTTTSNCLWTIVDTNDWISISSTSTTNFSYDVDPNPYPVERIGGIMVDGQTFVITQRAFVCTFELSPAAKTNGYGVSTGAVNVAAAPNCGWDVVKTNAWITITSGSSGTGNGVVAYTLDANPNPVDRTATILIGGQPFALTQRAVVCEYDISPASTTHGYGATTGTVALRTSSGCGWTIENTNAWISILSQSAGFGSNTVTYSVQASVNFIDRTGVVMIAAQAFTIRQSAVTCTYSISPASRLHGFGGSSGVVSNSTLATCSWLVVNTNGWITITSPMPPGGFSGNGTISYSVTNNPNPVPRTGVVMIADQAFVLSQRASTDGPPFAFEVIECKTNGEVHLRLAGAPAGVWDIQSSSNFNTWSHVAYVTNTTGLVEHTDPTGGTAKRRFYRAVLQQP